MYVCLCEQTDLYYNIIESGNTKFSVKVPLYWQVCLKYALPRYLIILLFNLL